jgi:hypothetical protein
VLLFILVGALVYIFSFVTAPLTILGMLLLARLQVKQQEIFIPSPKIWLMLFSVHIICTAVAWICWPSVLF